MIALKRLLPDRFWTPRVLLIGLWMLVLGGGVSVALHWLQDAAAIPAAPAATRTGTAVDLAAATDRAAAAPLFGEGAQADTMPALDGAPLDVKLKGVFAGGEGPMAAIVDTGGEEDEYVLLGREIRPGVALEGVHPTHIVVSRDGVTHRVDLQPVRSEASRSKAATRSGSKHPHRPPVAATAPETDVPVAPAGAEAPPLAPPMPQSDVGPTFRTA